MRLGICTSPANAETIARAGYDYIEPALNAVSEITDEAFAEVRGTFAAMPIRAEAFNCLFPGSIRLTGPEVDSDRVRAYLNAALARARELGAEVIVFGSGGSRRVPEGFSHDTALEQVAAMLKVAGPIAKQNDLTIVIEPLRAAEDNLINTAAAGLELATAVGHPNIRLLVDYYHMRSQNESPEIIRRAGNAMLRHCHIARLDGRRWPKPTDDEEYGAFFSALADIGYDGRLSIEGSTDDLSADARESIAFLRTATE
ncbi:MAG: sugar phosphate isomerase/epimerase [Spirochaetaceae bacterium]|nr:MAG: sugar phosphate isomerase/epimerase [Spirochaetaceae bacterium]